MNKKKQVLGIALFFIILGGLALAVLVAIGFDIWFNPSKDFPVFTGVVAIVAGVGFLIGCMILVLQIKGKKKRGKKY